MSFDRIESVIGWLGGIFACTTFGIIFLGIWRGTKRQVGQINGSTAPWLRSPWFYLASTLLFLGICYFGWVNLPMNVSPLTQVWMTVFGSLLYFPGLLCVLLSRLTLGDNYFVSTSFSAQLFAGHKLITRGPYAIIRHPMYIGLLLAALGSLLLYHTWTTGLLAVFAPFLFVRTYREEAALMAEFGEEWKKYSRRVPAYIPFIKRKN